MTTAPQPANPASLPEELLPYVAEQALICEFASVKQDGTPITAPLAPYLGDDGRTVDIATGLAYPLKADRARQNPRVALLYGDPRASLAGKPPVILIYGQATIYDADLQANLDRFVRLSSAASPTFARTPAFLKRWLSGYLARIWIAVTPLKIRWWPAGDLSAPPREWLAPAGAQAPPSDPPPKALARPHKAIAQPAADWRPDLNYALERLGPPTLTVVGPDGYPAPFRMSAATRHPEGARLLVPEGKPAEVQGRACLNFYTLQVKDGEMVANETVSFIGQVSCEDDQALFRVERGLPNLNIKGGLGGMLANIVDMRRIGRRAAVEASRRGQSPPEVRL